MDDIESVSEVIIVIATKGRASILNDTIASLSRQTLNVKALLLSVTDERNDVPGVLPAAPFNIEVIPSPVGAAAQRNTALRAISDSCTYVAFFDDDVEIHPTFLAKAVAFLDAHLEVAAISGNMLADGNVTRAEARHIVSATRHHNDASGFRHTGKHHTLYGCNMVIRRNCLTSTLFDESLPLNSFGEDYEISVRLMRLGLVGRLSNCVGVHLKAVSSRVSGKRLGYSVVANNWYFIQKGSCHLAPPWSYLRFASVIAAKPIVLNGLEWARGHIDRDPKGYILGSSLALLDILRRKSTPMRILEF